MTVQPLFQCPPEGPVEVQPDIEINLDVERSKPLSAATFEMIGLVHKLEMEGLKWARLTIPVDRSYTDDKGEMVERTVWIEAISCDRRLNEVIYRMNVKGRHVRLRGQIEVNEHVVEGLKIKETRFIVRSLYPLAPKPSA